MTLVTIKLKFGLVRNQAMTVIVQSGGSSGIVTPDKDLTAEIKIPLDLPDRISLQFTNKDAMTDTIVDEKGNIIEDKYVQFTDVKLDCFSLGEVFLHQKIKILTEDNNTIYTSYIGFNGIVTLDFEKDNVLEQYLSLH